MVQSSYLVVSQESRLGKLPAANPGPNLAFTKWYSPSSEPHLHPPVRRADLEVLTSCPTFPPSWKHNLTWSHFLSACSPRHWLAWRHSPVYLPVFTLFLKNPFGSDLLLLGSWYSTLWQLIRSSSSQLRDRWSCWSRWRWLRLRTLLKSFTVTV